MRRSNKQSALVNPKFKPKFKGPRSIRKTQETKTKRLYELHRNLLCLLYEPSAEIDEVGKNKSRQESLMNTFRTRRPLLVNATQCLHPTLILTDSGQRKAYPGDWIIEGENHERYIVDNTFFQRTFAPIPWESSSEGRHYGS
jgi:hypothetical protein